MCWSWNVLVWSLRRGFYLLINPLPIRLTSINVLQLIVTCLPIFSASLGRHPKYIIGTISFNIVMSSMHV